MLKGETVEGMQTFFRGKNGSYRIYENLNAVPEWLDKLFLGWMMARMRMNCGSWRRGLD